MDAKKQQVIDLLKSIETGDSAPAAVINPDRYVQHNLGVEDGLAGFARVLAQLPEGSARVDTKRVFRDGDFVFAHSEYNFFGPKVGFDIFRFEDGKIVEHWDNLQTIPESPNPSGRTMIDGPREAGESGQTESNRALVRSFVQYVLVEGQMDGLAGYFDGDRYLQHNPAIADGLSGLGAALEAMAARGVRMEYHRIHRVLAEGAFVLTVSEGMFAGVHSAFYDLFRVEDGHIAEHWDTIEEIPGKEHWKNPNGKF
jgi:predicted SnoaL-like aldol condensation-catalyzing enzyme